MLDEGVEVIVHSQDPVGDQREDSGGTNHPARFGIEAVKVEPMRRLRNGHEIRRAGSLPGRFRRCHAVLDARSRGGHVDLRRARVGRHHPLEAGRQRHRQLSGAASTIDRQTGRRRGINQKPDQ
jgi:hypothetical protein